MELTLADSRLSVYGGNKSETDVLEEVCLASAQLLIIKHRLIFRQLELFMVGTSGNCP